MAFYDISKEKGLTFREAAQRLEINGYNELPSQKKRNLFEIFLSVLKEPMLLLLLFSGAIYFILGEVKDASMLLTFVVVVIGITFYQERKTERALEALKNLSSPRALVIRDGKELRIPGREVVKNDIVILREGDRVPADGVMLAETNLSVDESLLTGESFAVRKSVWAGQSEMPQPGGEDLPYIFSGTLVVAGRGVMKVTETGIHTQMGKIGKELETIREEDTLLQKETGKLVRTFGAVGIILCVIIVIVYGLTRTNWLEGFLAGLTLSMAMLPEEFPVVLLIFLTLGAWRISKRNVLTRHTASIETLGAATVLCVDKTGTLTANAMELVSLDIGGKKYNLSVEGQRLPEAYHSLLEYGMLASQKDPFDPIEHEIRIQGEKYLSGTEHIHNTWELVREYPLSKKLLALSHVWQSKDKKNKIIAAKGAPEAIADLCHIDRKKSDHLMSRVYGMADKGLRVIAVAAAEFEESDLPDTQHDFHFTFKGLLGFIDPVRKAVPDAIEEAYHAGMRVIMITGDYPITATHIAASIGLANPGRYITGTELQKMKWNILREKIKSVNIFARVVPEQKLEIVKALKANGDIVAMTGDGVNDAPALKSAHIGVAMGGRGTDVARESADLVLLDDDFLSIVTAVRLGRRIFDNLKKAMSYIFAVHVPIAGMSLLPIIFGMPVVLFPAHIAFLELIIDPACSVVFEAEPEETNIMDRPPRNLKQPLFDRLTMLYSFFQGISVLIVTFTVFFTALFLGKGELEARTLTFTALIFSNIMLILTNLSWSKNIITTVISANRAMRYVISAALLFLLAVLYIPVFRAIFHFSLMTPEDLLITFIAGLVSVGWFEVVKWVNKQPFFIKAIPERMRIIVGSHGS